MAQPQFPMKYLLSGSVFKFGTNRGNLAWKVTALEGEKYPSRYHGEPRHITAVSENGSVRRFHTCRNVTIVHTSEWKAGLGQVVKNV